MADFPRRPCPVGTCFSGAGLRFQSGKISEACHDCADCFRICAGIFHSVGFQTLADLPPDCSRHRDCRAEHLHQQETEKTGFYREQAEKTIKTSDSTICRVGFLISRMRIGECRLSKTPFIC